MKEELQKLKKIYGTYGKVAEMIGISDRQLRNIKNGQNTSQPVINTIFNLLNNKESGAIGSTGAVSR